LNDKSTGNACLTDIDCECGQNLRQGRRYCGDQLKGRDCNPNVVFTCGPSYPNTIDGCLYGCNNGKCNTRKIVQKPISF
jgi:hypothetical protein